MIAPRTVLLGLLLTSSLASAAIEQLALDFAHVRGLAEERAKQPFRPPGTQLPRGLAALSPEEFAKIRFLPEQALWLADELPFRLTFAHRGPGQAEEVVVHEHSATHVQRVPFVKEFFDYGDLGRVGWLRSSLNYAGFGVQYPVNRQELHEEAIRFTPTAFRAIASGQVPGVWARGATVDCGVEGKVEETPVFTQFWVGKPEAGAKSLVVHALLDSPGLTGAYAMTFAPGKVTTMDVRAVWFLRHEISAPGFAPLISRFWYGENSPRPVREIRPEAHHSDGLWIEERGGRLLWQPLQAQPVLRTTDIEQESPVRFGLLQRDRSVNSYQDLEERLQDKPSAWIEPRGEWGKGVVRLVELPNPSGRDDNVLAFWVPEERPRPGNPYELSYRIAWGAEPVETTLARVVATREGRLGNRANGRLFWVDFAGEAAAALQDEEVAVVMEGEDVERVVAHRAVRHPSLPGWRAVIEVDAGADRKPLRLRARLVKGREPISETWSYTWTP